MMKRESTRYQKIDNAEGTTKGEPYIFLLVKKPKDGLITHQTIKKAVTIETVTAYL